MALRNTDHSWGALARLMHWAIALLIFTQFALGWMAVSWRLSPTKLNLYVWHKSIGILILLLVVLRVVWRFVNRTPALPADTPPFERAGAHASHALLYVLMLAMPLSGWVINSASNIPLRVFWLFPLPSIVAADKAVEAIAKQVHFSLFIVLAIVVALHIAAALRHHIVKRNDVLTRMLTGGTRI
ncbi:MAG: cytochrome b [Sulfurifustaceae bacterium]